ncbi:MAG: DinB family protein [Acidobacteriota bacterium]|nr:DinB family protein [Acidobacteriota bacterium]
MNYHSVAEIYEAIDDTRKRLLARLADLNAEQQNFRPADDVWCAADIAEHLSITEGQIVKLMNKLLAKADSNAATDTTDSGDANTAQTPPAFPFTLDHFAEKVRDIKINAPESVRPCGTIPLADSLAKLRESRAALHALRPRLEAADLSAVLFPHPAFGPINAYQWLAVTGLHEARHLKQLERLLKDE